MSALVEHSNQKRMAGAAAKLEPTMHLEREDTRLDCPSPQDFCCEVMQIANQDKRRTKLPSNKDGG